MQQLPKFLVQSGLDRLDYGMRCTRSIPKMMLEARNAVEHTFRHSVTELMHRIGRSEQSFFQADAFNGVSYDPLRAFVQKYN
jgi:hypothetical protein